MLSFDTKLRRRDAEIFADLPGKVVVDFGVSGNSRRFAGGTIDEDGVVGAFSQQFAPVILQVPNERPALHAPTLNGSRISSPPVAVSAMRSRFA